MALTHSTFEELFDAIADAIREQEGSSAEIIADTFPTRIRSLTSTGAGLDTSDATATASMIQEGYTAYVNGSKITGNVPAKFDFTFPLGAGYNATASATTAALTLALINPTKTIVNTGATIQLQAGLNQFGTVTPSDVILGSTFTSTAGLNKTGTLNLNQEISDQQNLIQQIQEALVGKSAGMGGITLPTLENPGTASDLARDKQLIGADGNVVQGMVNTIDSGWTGMRSYTAVSGNSIDNPQVCNIYEFDSNELYRKGSMISVDVPCEAYGNATAADVKQGKTFTSVDGFLTEGTASIGKTITGVGSHSGSGYYISENAEGTLKPVTMPSNCFAVSGVVNLTNPSYPEEQYSIHNFYLDTKLNLANAVSFFIPALVYQTGMVSVYGFRDNEGWTTYYYSLSTYSGGMIAMMRSDEMLMINSNNRIQYQGNTFTTSFVDSGKIPLLPFSGLSSSDSAELLNGFAFMSDSANYNGIPAGPDIIITYTE